MSTTREYRIASVRRNREDGRENVLLADLVSDDVVVMRGTLAHVIRTCEERGYHVINIEQAKAALSRE